MTAKRPITELTGVVNPTDLLTVAGAQSLFKAIGATDSAWGSITGDISSQTDLVALLADKADVTHVHVIADVTGLQLALDGKALSSHNHDADYAALSHGHAIADVTGLQTALDGKQAAGSYASATHGHAIADVTGLQTALDGKSATTHNHDADYAALSHSHAVADVTGLQTALDGKLSLTGGTVTGTLTMSGTSYANGFTVRDYTEGFNWGYVALSKGSATNTGYMSFYRPASAGRAGYIGSAGTSTINIFADTGYSYNFNTMPSVGSILLPSKLYVQSRGENLVSNGTGLLNDNTNFSQFTFDSTDAYFSNGCFVNSTYNASPTNDETMPVDPAKTYRLTGSLKADPYVGSKAYLAVTAVDADGLTMSALTHMYSSEVTTLAADLNPGATTITLTDATGWDAATIESQTYKRGIIVWNYVNALGYAYPPETYSRNYYTDLWESDASVNVGTGVITLTVPWAGPAIPAGTSLSRSNSGSSYKYIAASNVTVPDTWTTYTGTIGGVDTTGTNVTTKFPPGAAGAKVQFLLNRDVVGGATKIANVSFGVDNEAAITAGTTAQYWRGDKTWQTLNATAVGLGNVNNTSDANKPISTATQTALDGKSATTHDHDTDYAAIGHNHDATYQPLDAQLTDFAALSYTGNAGKVLKVNATGDGLEWATDATGGGGGSSAWGGITGTLSDQTDLQTALDAKAPTANPTFTGTVTADSGSLLVTGAASPGIVVKANTTATSAMPYISFQKSDGSVIGSLGDSSSASNYLTLNAPSGLDLLTGSGTLYQESTSRSAIHSLNSGGGFEAYTQYSSNGTYKGAVGFWNSGYDGSNRIMNLSADVLLAVYGDGGIVLDSTSTNTVDIWNSGGTFTAQISSTELIVNRKARFVSYTNATPANGDIWFDGTTLKKHIGGVTSDLDTSGGSPVWGTITGTLSDQTDLQTALDGKSATTHDHSGVYATASHTHTKADVGLGNVDNTSDANKPISTATQTALDLKLDASQKGAVSGVASLDGSGKIPTSQLPALVLTDVYSVASEAAQLALTAQEGDVAIRSDLNKSFIHNGGTAGTIADWSELLTPTDAVLSVNGATGAVTLTKSSVGLGSVDNTADTAKPVSTAQQTALNLKANLASPTFTGTVTASTISTGTLAATGSYGITIGDDAIMGDTNVANTVGLKGQQDATKGLIRFGNTTTDFGWNGSHLVFGSVMTLGTSGNFSVTGTVTGTNVTATANVSSLVFHLNGGGAAIAAGQTFDLPELPFDCTVTGWTITADASGSAVVDVLRSTYAGFPTMSSIAGTEKPTLSSAQKNQDTALSTWTTTLDAGDILRASVSSASGINALTITLKVTRT